MEFHDKILQIIGIPYSALISIIFGMILLSFPVGIYLVFNSDIGNEINFEYPIQGFDLFLAGISLQIPIEYELGDAFIVIWAVFVILFSISLFGPEKDFLKTIGQIVTQRKRSLKTNYLVSMICWFSVLILISGIINIVQEGFGVTIEIPSSENELIRFFDISKAPIIEEIGFRLVLIGLPLYVVSSNRTSFRHFFKSLWHPHKNLKVDDTRKILALIIVVAVFFGVAHIISEEGWSTGKFTQALVSGIIIGWAYYRHGLVCAILIHWATNYFIFSYAYLIAEINSISLDHAFSHSLLTTVEILIILCGILSIVVLSLNYYLSKKEPSLKI